MGTGDWEEDDLARVKYCPACDCENPPTSVFCSRPDCGAPLHGVPLTEPRVPPPAAAGPETVLPSPSGAGAACPDPSCTHVNPAGAERCGMCHGPLTALPSRPATLLLQWPWGTQPLSEPLGLGRDPAFSILAKRLDAYPNLSRRHALLRLDQGQAWIEDLGSTNGTYLDGTRLPPRQPQRLTPPARLRFGMTDALELTLTLAEEPPHGPAA